MSAPNKLKRKREYNPNVIGFGEPDTKRQKLAHTEDKPLRYLLIFTHTLIANYEEIMKDSWIRSLKYIINQTNKDDALIAGITEFINGLALSTFVEDDLVDKIFKHIRMYQTKYNKTTLITNDNLKYELMQIKDKFFEDNMHKIELKKGIRILLRELRENLKWTLCLMHKDSRETYNLILNDIGLRGYFNAFVCAPSIANYNRPYFQLYEQSISRCRIFKQQCIVLVDHEIEALEAIYFGIYPILISNKNTKLNGKYFLLKQDDNWMQQIQKLLISIKRDGTNIDSLDKLINNNKCLQSKDNIKFINDDGKIYCGAIDKLSIPSPVKIFRINYIDSEQNRITCLKQSYLIWET